MDATPHSLFSSILVVSVILGVVIFYFIISLVRQQRRSLRLYRQSIAAEITAMEGERARIAADLHDELGPMLSAIKLRISSFDLADEEDVAQMEKTCTHLDSLIQRIREISYDLLPNTLTRKGLVYAVRAFTELAARGAPLQISFEAPDDLQVDGQKAVHLYRIVQEVVHNAVRHSGAATLHITLMEQNGKLVLQTTDDGRGFDHQAIAKEGKGLGLRNLLSRTEILGGKMFIESEKDKGTRYTFEVPV